MISKIEDSSMQGLFNAAVAGVVSQGKTCTLDGDCEYRLSLIHI